MLGNIVSYKLTSILTIKVFCLLNFGFTIESDNCSDYIKPKSVCDFMLEYSTIAFLSCLCISSVKAVTKSYSLEQIFNPWKCQATLLGYSNIQTSEQGLTVLHRTISKLPDKGLFCFWNLITFGILFINLCK